MGVAAMGQQERILDRIHSAEHVLAMFDYDGTLAPFTVMPEEAHLPPPVKERLKAMLAHARITAGVLSGRALTDLKDRVGLDGLVFGGNHGLEIYAPDFQFVEPEACRHEPELRRILKHLEDELVPYPRARIEDKTLTATVHARELNAVDVLEVGQAIRDVLVGYQAFHCRVGRMSFDIVPHTDWNKGRAIQLIRRRLGLEDALVLYAGDDTSDEDAFRLLPEDITIKVGLEESAATYRYETPQELWALMRALVLAVSPAA